MAAEETGCGGCGASAKLAFVARDLNRAITPEAFPYYRCASCGLVFLHPVPRDLGRYYPSNYHEIPRTVEELLRGSRRREGFKLDAIAPWRGRRLLEIGPSFGAFAALAKQAGFDVQAMEMDEECSRFISEVVGIPTQHTGDVLGALTARGRFDVIAMWHSLEHLANPWQVIDALPEHVEPGGALFFATPNPGSLQFRLFGRRWVHLDAPRHVNLIPHRLLEKRLAAKGMRRIHFTTSDRGARDCNLLGWIASVRTSVPRWQRSRLASLAWRLSIPLSRLVERGEYGAAYTVGFVKDGTSS
jgi:2-polyprenyl-3-methyl-5-hydroxy-6-metoxy-1,4-benzoquinol methylase